ncbi:MAG: RNase P subunit p30 family protein [Candidatus Pacearchaeota archaeon]
MEYVIIKEATFERARKEIKKSKDKKIIFSSEDDELNRKIIESEKIEILLLNQANRKDFQKQRNSGFNQVMAKIAKNNKIEIGINLDEIVESSPKEKSQILARIRQNIKLCNKAKLKMKFIIQKKENQRNVYDLKSLGLILGMPTWMVKEI